MFNKKKNLDIRDIFFGNINKIFNRNKDVYILTNDADVFALHDLKKSKRFIDVGVCEQNLINIAAGLASQKKKIIVFGFCNFLIHRAYEQIKINIGSMNLPIKIIGIGPGFSFPYDGPTHHATNDISNVFSIPEFEIINISDPLSANHFSKKIFSINRPVYIRLDKGIFPIRKYFNFKDGYNFFHKGKKNKILIISSGYFSHLAFDLTKRLKTFDLINIYKFREFNKNKFNKIVKKYKNILIYDENTYEGGIASIIQKNFSYTKHNCNFYFKLVPSHQIFLYSQKRNELLEKLKLNSIHLEKFITKLGN